MVRGPGKRKNVCGGSELGGMVEGAGKGMKGKDEAGGVVGNRGLMSHACLPEGVYLGGSCGPIDTLERSIQ